MAATPSQGTSVLYTQYEDVMTSVLNLRQAVGLTYDRDTVLPNNPILKAGSGGHYTLMAVTINELDTAATEANASAITSCTAYHSSHRSAVNSTADASHLVSHNGSKYTTNLGTHRASYRNGANSSARSPNYSSHCRRCNYDGKNSYRSRSR